MATIIEIQESKVENLTECAEKIVLHGKKLLKCLSELDNEKYSERYGRRHRDEEYDREYPRYY